MMICLVIVMKNEKYFFLWIDKEMVEQPDAQLKSLHSLDKLLDARMKRSMCLIHCTLEELDHLQHFLEIGEIDFEGELEYANCEM